VTTDRPSPMEAAQAAGARLRAELAKDDGINAFIDWLSKGWGREWGAAQDVEELARAMDPDMPDSERIEAISGVAQRLSHLWRPDLWRPERRVGALRWRRAVDRAAEDGLSLTDIKRRALEYGLLRAAAEAKGRQRLRPVRMPGAPTDGPIAARDGEPLTGLPWFEFTFWMRSKLFRYAEQWLLEEYGDVLSGERGEALTILPEDGVSAEELDRLASMRYHEESESAEHREALQRVSEIVERVGSPRQKEMFARLMELGNKALVCEALLISPENYDVQLRRLTRKLRKEVGTGSEAG